jgi:hypothetical protein
MTADGAGETGGFLRLITIAKNRFRSLNQTPVTSTRAVPIFHPLMQKESADCDARTVSLGRSSLNATGRSDALMTICLIVG